MYDPTVFENLKVAFENQVYDLDTIEREIRIINRIGSNGFRGSCQEIRYSIYAI